MNSKDKMWRSSNYIQTHIKEYTFLIMFKKKKSILFNLNLIYM